MNKKKRLWFGFGAFVIAATVFVYWWFFSSPSSFPKQAEAVEGINQVFADAHASQIQDVIEVSERKRFVPFITDYANYGVSLWVWSRNEWKARNISMVGDPMLWKVEEGDPSSYHVFWNIHPDDAVEEIDFYLMRERGYHITNSVNETYQPGVQMKKSVTVADQSYGVLPLPEGWSHLMESFRNINQDNGGLFSSMSHHPYVRFGWRPLNSEEENIFPSKSVNGSSYSGGERLEHMILINPSDIEVPVDETS
ncbi:hypothetical protein H0266_16935 [Halobacillus locisalis]|uniref:Uncharacterized protein n=1 Tax=Halobacillus locisalis TaxID=220753 RepID=A0A838CXS7_9BACI|nr:hypothetical protein [Halobacillus locisalis]MBA2176575.1 hypothetical protein [Halobacillus locisalis]